MVKFMTVLSGQIQNLYYEGDGTEEKTVYTKEEVEAMMDNQKKTFTNTIQRTTEQLEALKKSGYSEDERKKMEETIKNLQEANMSKDDILKRELAAREKDYSGKLQEQTKQTETWRTRYIGTLKEQAIISAAVEHGAFSVDQIKDILNHRTTMVEDLDEKGQGLGTYKPQVTLQDGEGKQLKLSPKDALTRMKQEPNLWGNLFKSNLTGGFGGTNSDTSKPTPQEIAANPGLYRQNRDQFVK